MCVEGGGVFLSEFFPIGVSRRGFLRDGRSEEVSRLGGSE